MLAEIAHFYPQLPAVIASHFSAAGVANGWAPKAQFFTEITPIVVGFLAIFTFLTSRFPQISGLGWLVMVIEYWGSGLFVMLTHATLMYNLGRARTLNVSITTWSLIMFGALVVGEVGRIRAIRKQANAEQGSVVAEYRHGSQGVGAVFGAIGLASILLPVALHATGPGLAVPVMVGVVILACAVWAYSGFGYRLTTAGLEIRMFGVPIRFIPRDDIAFVQAQSCNPLTDFGGWGIRGIGQMRAYIWGGSRCVQIRTHSGDKIYLGIADADRLAREIESLLPVEQV
jgi:hypothetical protein